MRKLLTLTLALVILLTSSYSVLGDESAAQYTPTESQAEALDLLEAIGVVDEADYAGGNIFIKRGMAAKLAVRLYNIDNVAKQDTGFTDVGANNELSGYIYMAKNLELVNGTGNNRFSPDSYVNYEQVAKIMVNVLGRYRQAETYGGYSDGYLNAATRLGILKHFSVADKNKITIYEIAPLLLDVLETDIEDPLNTVIESDEKDDFLHRFFDIEKYRATVEADYYIARDGSSTDAETILRLGDMEVNTDGYIPDMVGESITAYLKDAGTDDCSLVWYKKNFDNTRTVIDSRDILSASTASRIVYSENSSTKTEGISGAVFIKNGEIRSVVTDSDINITNGTVTLVSSNSSACDTVIIEEYQDLVVKAVYDEETVGLKNAYIDNNGISSNKIVIDTDGTATQKTLFTNWDNKKISIEDCEEDDVLSVAVSDKLVKIVRSDRCIAGTIEAMGEDTVVIDGEEINLAATIINTDITLKLGLDALFSLNHRGVLVWVGEQETLGADAAQYGYIVAINRTNGLSPIIQVKLFTQTGRMETYNVAEKLKFNSPTKQDSSVMLSVLSPLLDGGELKEQIVKFKLNDNNEIKELYTPMSSEGMDDATRRDSFTVDYESSDTQKLIGSPAYMFLSKYLVRNRTFIFTVPEAYDGDNDDEYQITPLTDLEHNMEFDSLTLYDVDPESNVIGAMVDKRAVVARTDVYSVSGVITKTGECLNKDGYFVKYFDIYNYKGNHKRYTVEDVDVEFYKAITDSEADSPAVVRTETVEVSSTNTFDVDFISADELNVGDVVQLEANSFDEITALSVLFRYETPVVMEVAFDKFGKLHSSSSLTQESNYAPILTSYCPVEKVSNYGFTTTVPYYHDNSIELERIQFFGTSLVLLYDSADKEVKPITWEDIIPGEDMAFIHRENRTQRLIVIYR